MQAKKRFICKNFKEKYYVFCDALVGFLEKFTYKMENYSESFKWAIKYLNAVKQKLGDKHPFIISLSNFIAKIYEKLGEQDNANNYRCNILEGSKKSVL